MDSLTTYKLAYAKRKSETLHSQRGMRPMAAQLPFCATTSYNTQFVNWGTCQISPISASKKLYAMPFKGQTTYKDCFAAIDLKAKAEPIKSM